MTLVTLGPEGTYSELAAKEWDSSEDIVLKSSPRKVVDAVGRGFFGILPIENSIQGTVVRTVDLLRTNDIEICGELILEINHCLIGSGKKEIKTVVSHPQALAQSREFINQKFPNAEVQAAESTANAVKKAQNNEKMVAVAPRHAAQKYGLKILYENIQDVEDNQTRFIVLGENDHEPSGNDKTSLIFYVENNPGSLYNCLGAFAKNNVNLTKLESRPSREKLGDYYFYIDFEGHRRDNKVKKAIDELKQKAREVKLLGSYPKRQEPSP
ncbi:prephenate dehydratase [archaeon SCG-AAA382B04]|nr:prephenate dehydratase [archaeon SCG-AAA382B04]